MNNHLETVLPTIVRWLARQEECDVETFLTPDFTFEDGLDPMPLDDFMIYRRGRGAVDELSFLDMAIADTRAAIMFEGVDSVTGLYHRICWMIVLDGGLIKRITSCVGTAFRAPERPSHLRGPG